MTTKQQIRNFISFQTNTVIYSYECSSPTVVPPTLLFFSYCFPHSLLVLPHSCSSLTLVPPSLLLLPLSWSSLTVVPPSLLFLPHRYSPFTYKSQLHGHMATKFLGRPPPPLNTPGQNWPVKNVSSLGQIF
jgi:hypothetical protein